MRNCKRTLGFMLPLLAAVAGASAQTGKELPRSVAIVDGVRITEKDVLFDEKSLPNLFFGEYGRDPAGPDDQATMETTKWDLQCGGLVDGITRVLVDEEASRRKIGVSQDEATQDYQSKLRQADPERSAAQTRATAKALLAALDEVAKGADPEEVYRRRLAERGVNERAWEVTRREAADPVYRGRLERLTTVTGAIPAKAPAGYEWNVLRDKVYAAIEQDIAASDARVAQFLDERKGAGGSPASHVGYVDKKRFEWYRRRYAELDVTILNPGFAEACKQRLAGLGVKLPAPPQ